MIAGIVKEGKKAAKSKGVKNLVNSPIRNISLLIIILESNKFFLTNNIMISVSIIEASVYEVIPRLYFSKLRKYKIEANKILKIKPLIVPIQI